MASRECVCAQFGSDRANGAGNELVTDRRTDGHMDGVDRGHNIASAMPFGLAGTIIMSVTM